MKSVWLYIEGNLFVIKWLWYGNLALVVGALVILVVGLSTLPAAPPELAGGYAGEHSSGESSDGQAASSTGGDPAGSPLLAAAASFAKRLAPPPPPPPKPKPQPKPAAPKPKPQPEPPKPEPPKPAPPKPKPKPKTPPPKFTVEATFITGRYENGQWVTSQVLARIRLPNGKDVKSHTVGDKIDEYTIAGISEGVVEVVRDGAAFKLEVPKPKPGAAAPPPAAAKPQPPRPAPRPRPTARQSSRYKKKR